MANKVLRAVIYLCSELPFNPHQMSDSAVIPKRQYILFNTAPESFGYEISHWENVGSDSF